MRESGSSSPFTPKLPLHNTYEALGLEKKKKKVMVNSQDTGKEKCLTLVKLAEGALNSTVNVIDEDMKEYWPQH